MNLSRICLRKCIPTVSSSHQAILRFQSTASDANELFHRIVQKERIALAKSITLVESTSEKHKKIAQELVSQALQVTNLHLSGMNISLDAEKQSLKSLPSTIRIGLSGSPGVGKSTFIEAFGMHLANQGIKVAVLAVDPSSTLTGGSILGDVTRMPELSKHALAYVRPSPSRGTLGGVARNTSDAIVLCEAAGFEVILIETVGVGQSEVMVADMVDAMVLLVAPAAGDELQGIKKGIVERSDLILVNKSDGAFEAAARLTQSEYISALKYFNLKDATGWSPRVLRVSATTSYGLPTFEASLVDFYRAQMKSGKFLDRRKSQRRIWMNRLIQEELKSRMSQDDRISRLTRTLERQVALGQVTPGQAAERIVDSFLNSG